ncbi:hypothetical protein FO519_005624 [Halicephalobus sp. NKZ332]|nr:hypothetical protein FO519_005624 [Halicephalobus sp. NKZ332]
MTGYSSKTNTNRSDQQAGPSTSWINGTNFSNGRKSEGGNFSATGRNGDASTSAFFGRDSSSIFGKNDQKQKTEATKRGSMTENVIVIDVPPDTETGISSKESPTENRKKKIRRKKVKGNHSPHSGINHRSSSNDPLANNEARVSDRSLSPTSPDPANRPRRQSEFGELNISVQSPTVKTVQSAGTAKMAPDQETSVVEKPEDLDEMILVQRKKKNKAKNSPPDSYKSDQGKQNKPKNNYLKSPKRNDKNEAESKRDRKHHQKLKIEPSKSSRPNPTSFDMENDFPPLSGGQLSPTNRRENQILYTEVIQKQKTPASKKDSEQLPVSSKECYDQPREEARVPESCGKGEAKALNEVPQASNDPSDVDKLQKDEKSTVAPQELKVQSESSNSTQKLKSDEETQFMVSEMPEDQSQKVENIENKESLSGENQREEKNEVVEKPNESQKTEEMERTSENSYRVTTANYILTSSADDPKVLTKTKVNDQKFIIQNNISNERNSGFRPRNQQYQNFRRRNEHQSPYLNNDFSNNGYMNGSVPIQGTSFQQNYQHIPQTMYQGSAYYFAPNSPAYASFLPVTPHHASGFIPDQSYIPIQGPFYSSNGNPVVFSNGRPWEYIGGNGYNPEIFGIRPPLIPKFQPDPSTSMSMGIPYQQAIVNPIGQDNFKLQQMRDVDEMFPAKEFITRSSSVPLPEPINGPDLVATSDMSEVKPQYVSEMRSQDEEQPQTSSTRNDVLQIQDPMVHPNAMPQQINEIPQIQDSVLPNSIPQQVNNIPERVDTLTFSPELQKWVGISGNSRAY